MTNLEWLIKKQRYSEFMRDIYCHDKDELNKKWKVSTDTLTESLDDCIAEWLERKHIFTEYVKLEDVLGVINTHQELSEEILDQIKEELLKLNIKEEIE